MGVNFSLNRKGSDQEVAYVILAGSTGWSEDWLTAAEELELDLIPLLGNGTFASLPGELVPEVIRQLGLVLEWMKVNRPETRHIAAIEEVIEALTMAEAEGISQYEISFG